MTIFLFEIRCNQQPPWRNRLARSAVNRKVGGSSPPGGGFTFYVREYVRLSYDICLSYERSSIRDKDGNLETFLAIFVFEF